jgi:hypothetical protein
MMAARRPQTPASASLRIIRLGAAVLLLRVSRRLHEPSKANHPAGGSAVALTTAQRHQRARRRKVAGLFHLQHSLQHRRQTRTLSGLSVQSIMGATASCIPDILFSSNFLGRVPSNRNWVDIDRSYRDRLSSLLFNRQLRARKSA